jgi:hypothetical protein
MLLRSLDEAEDEDFEEECCITVRSVVDKNTTAESCDFCNLRTPVPNLLIDASEPTDLTPRGRGGYFLLYVQILSKHAG